MTLKATQDHRNCSYSIGWSVVSMWLLRYASGQTDRQTDRQTDK